MKKNTLIVALKIAVTLLFVFLLIQHLDGMELMDTLAGVDLTYLLLGFAFSFALIAVSCWKWWYILRCQDCAIPFPTLYRWYFIGYFYTNFLPSNVGGDVARAWLVARRHQSGSAALISVFAERFTGSLVLLGLALVMPFTAATGLWRLPSVWMIMGGAAGLLACLLLLIRFGAAGARSAWMAGWMRGLQRLLRADRPGRLARLWAQVDAKGRTLADKAGRLLAVLRRNPRAAWTIFGLTLLFYAMTVVNVLLAYRAFGVWADAGAVAAVLPIALMVGMIPVTLGNLGITEGAYVFYFGLAGLPRELTLAMSLFLRLKVLTMGAIGLIVHLREGAKPPAEGVPAVQGDG